MKTKLLVTICVFVVLGLVGFSRSSPSVTWHKPTYKIPDTPETKEVMKTIEKAYGVEAEAAHTFDIKKFPAVFINDPRFPVSSGTLETIKELTNNPDLESAGWLDYKEAYYSWRIGATLHAEKIAEKARQENRDLTEEERKSLVDSKGRIAPAREEGPIKKASLIFMSIEVDGDVAAVVLDDGPRTIQLTLVLVDNQWYIAGSETIYIHP